MNVYEKIQVVKQELLKENVKKSGENKYAGFKYYELGDFLPVLIKLCAEQKLHTKVTFDNDTAKLIITNSEKPDEKEEYTSPMRDLELKGCNKIQALGGIETYQRRYLYMSAFDIVENDMFDATSGKEEKKNETNMPKPLTDNQAMVLYKAIKNKIPEDEKIKQFLLENYNVEKTNQLTDKDYFQIVKHFKEEGK